MALLILNEVQQARGVTLLMVPNAGLTLPLRSLFEKQQGGLVAMQLLQQMMQPPLVVRKGIADVNKDSAAVVYAVVDSHFTISIFLDNLFCLKQVMLVCSLGCRSKPKCNDACFEYLCHEHTRDQRAFFGKSLRLPL